jgi:hypothetical protein
VLAAETKDGAADFELSIGGGSGGGSVKIGDLLIFRRRSARGQLSKQSLGQVNIVLTKFMSRFTSASASVTEWLRQTAYDRPLITLLLAGQAGYLLAR